MTRAPFVGLAADPDGDGYWAVGTDGGVFSSKNSSGRRRAVAFYGSMGGKPLNQPMAGIAAAFDGNGYYLVGQDGGVFVFGPGAALLRIRRGRPSRELRQVQPGAPPPSRTSIVTTAEAEVGTVGELDGVNKYGPADQWSSSFASWVWQRSGVRISVLPYAGSIAGVGISARAVACRSEQQPCAR